MSPRNDVSLDHEPSTSGKAAPPMSLTSSEFRNSLSSKSLGFPCNNNKKKKMGVIILSKCQGRNGVRSLKPLGKHAAMTTRRTRAKTKKKKIV